jgi:hypothetical protein
MRVQMSELFGKQAATGQDGLRLNELIEPVLARGEAVVLDYEGMDRFTTVFFTSSIGLLIEKDTPNRLPELLQHENLPHMGQLALSLATDNAIRRRENPRWAQAQDEVMRRWGEAERE